MERELIQIVDFKQTMSSLEIAMLTGKPHNDVLKAIRAMEPAWEKVNGGKFSRVEYKDAKGEMRPAFELTKTECLYVATKFNDEARAKLVIRWEELEKKARANMLQLPDFTNPAEAARAWAQEYEQKTTLMIENKQLEEENIQLALENQELKNDKNYLDPAPPPESLPAIVKTEGSFLRIVITMPLSENISADVPLFLSRWQLG